jgi:hypothetical protein
VGQGPVWKIHRKQKPFAVIKNPTAIFVGRTARTVIEQTGLTCSMLLKFACFCRFREADKLIENRQEKAKVGDGEEDRYTLASLDYMEKAISYIYRWYNAESIGKDVELDAKKAAKKILVMVDRLTKVTEFWGDRRWER